MKNIHLLNRLQLLIILIALGGAVFYLLHFSTLPQVYRGFSDVWLLDMPSDPQFSERKIFIHTGMGISLLSFLLFAAMIFIRRRGQSGFWFGMTAFMLVFMICWRSYPYWAYALQDIFATGGNSCYDPKALLPMALMGEYWRFPVLILQMLVWPLSLFILLREIIIFRANRKLLPLLLIVLMVLLQAVVVVFTPGYLEWLLD
jgi:hypothetical protein